MPSFLLELTRTARAVLAVAAALAAVATPQAQAAGVPGQGTWATTLQGRNLDGNAATFEAYYDTALNITWLADANYARTTNYAAARDDGRMTWFEAQTWVANLNVNGVTGWRLPNLVDTGAAGCDNAFSGTDCGYNVSPSTSEMAHLFYVTLGNSALFDTAGNRKPPYDLYGFYYSGPFKGSRPGNFWSGVEYAPDKTRFAWVFAGSYGLQGAQYKNNELVAWAVRSGDVAAVPEPQTYALMLLGLVAVLVARQRRHA